MEIITLSNDEDIEITADSENLSVDIVAGDRLMLVFFEDVHAFNYFCERHNIIPYERVEV